MRSCFWPCFLLCAIGHWCLAALALGRFEEPTPINSLRIGLSRVSLAPKPQVSQPKPMELPIVPEPIITAKESPVKIEAPPQQTEPKEPPKKPDPKPEPLPEPKPIAKAETEAPVVMESSGAVVDIEPTRVFGEDPMYPPDAIAARAYGKVMLWISIRANGTVESATVHRTSGWKSMDDEAVRAVKLYRFSPAKLHGKAVAVERLYPVKFRLFESRSE